MKKIFTLSLVLLSMQIYSQDTASFKEMEVYGFIMADAGYNMNAIHPDWFDTMRPTKILDGNGNTYFPEGNAYFSVRQTRFGVKNWFQTSKGTLFTQFEWEMFGTGVDAGQTTIRLRHAYAELGKFGVGQYWSPFMDIDVFPNTVEYWGPNGMVFFRNVQIRYMPIKEDNRKMTIALERPGASADQGNYGEGFEYFNYVSQVAGRFPIPDLSAEYRHGGKWGYVELAGIVRYIGWEDPNASDTLDLTGNTMGYGLNLSTNIKLGSKATFRGSVTGGAGIQNYMNDADVDIGIVRQDDNAKTPITGEAIPMLSFVAFVDINWSDKFSSAIGYSQMQNTNTEGQNQFAFETGQYAAANLLYYPAKNCMMGVEFQWGARTNNDFDGDDELGLDPVEGESASISKVQFSFKYNFSQSFYKRNK